MHRLTKIRENLAGAVMTSFFFVRVAGLATDQFAVFKSHTSSANPVLPVADVDMIELGHSVYPYATSVLGLRKRRLRC